MTTTVRAGTLSMSQAGDAVQLSAVDFGQGGASTGALQTVTVKDFRGGPAGWSLTGKVTDFNGPGAKIDAGKLSWTPVCATKAGSPSTCQAGSAGTVGASGATLASTPDGTATGGEFTANAQLSLDVPSFTPPGTYGKRPDPHAHLSVRTRSTGGRAPAPQVRTRPSTQPPKPVRPSPIVRARSPEPVRPSPIAGARSLGGPHPCASRTPFSCRSCRPCCS